MGDNMRNQYKFINLSRYLRENNEDTIVLTKGDTESVKSKSSIVNNTEIEVQFKYPTKEESDIKEKVLRYYSETIKDENGRYKSWEHCHSYFLRIEKMLTKK